MGFLNLTLSIKTTKLLQKFTELLPSQNTYDMMPRLTRVGNYYCREDPPKARVWEDDTQRSSNIGNDCNHVLVTDAEGGLRSSLKRTRSFSAKNLLKAKSLQNVSKKSTKKLTRSMSTYSDPYKREFKAAETKAVLSTEIDPTYKVLKEALVIRSKSVSSSKQSLRGSRRTSESSNKSKSSAECTQVINSLHDGQRPLTHAQGSSKSMSLSESPTLFHQRFLKNQNKMISSNPHNDKNNGLKPLMIDIPIESSKKENSEKEIFTPSVNSNRRKESIESLVNTRSFGNNSPSGGSNNSSKSVHFATDLKPKSLSQSACSTATASVCQSKNEQLSKNSSPMETNFDEHIHQVNESSNPNEQSILEKKHKNSFPKNERNKSNTKNASPKHDPLLLSSARSTFSNESNPQKNFSTTRDRKKEIIYKNGIPQNLENSENLKKEKTKLFTAKHGEKAHLENATDLPILEKIIKEREKNSKSLPYKRPQNSNKGDGINISTSKHSNYVYIEQKLNPDSFRHSGERPKHLKTFQNMENPMYSTYNDKTPTMKTSKEDYSKKCASVSSRDSRVTNIYLPANNQLFCQQSNLSQKVPNRLLPSPLTSKYSKSTDDLKKLKLTNTLSMPLSSKMILSGDFPGYQPPNADSIPFADDSIPYVLDDPPLNLTTDSITKSKERTYINNSSSELPTKKQCEENRNLNCNHETQRTPNESQYTNHLITIKIEPDKSETNETKVLIHDNHVIAVDNNKQIGNNKFITFISFKNVFGFYFTFLTIHFLSS